MSKEIEIRHELFNEANVENFFMEKGIYPSKSVHQIDTYYDDPNDSFFKDPDHITTWVRIREENEKLLFTYKHWLPEGAKICTHCEEKEYPMNSKQEMPQYLENFGMGTSFIPFIVTDKLRKSFMYKECEISIDKVKDLGNYIEIEYKGKNINVDEVIKLLNQILVEIGAKVGPADHKGYAYHIFKMQKYGGYIFK